MPGEGRSAGSAEPEAAEAFGILRRSETKQKMQPKRLPSEGVTIAARNNDLDNIPGLQIMHNLLYLRGQATAPQADSTSAFAASGSADPALRPSPGLRRISM